VTDQYRDDNPSMGDIIQRARLGTAALCVVALGACTAIGGTPVPGWPELQIVEHHVPHSAMRDHCERYVGFGQSPAACAEFDFPASRCDIWYSVDFPPQQFIIEHERLHCRGYEHIGEHHLREALSRYRAASDPPLTTPDASPNPRVAYP
jgi:hypothetical protein